MTGFLCHAILEPIRRGHGFSMISHYSPPLFFEQNGRNPETPEPNGDRRLM